jgi:flagellar biosynthesis/type III secretory pathway chaperone
MVQERINPTQLSSYKDLLVREFRAYQNLVAVTEDERKALQVRDVSRLEALVERKDSLLDEIKTLESERSKLAQTWLEERGHVKRSFSLVEIFPYLEVEDVEMLNRLREGILVLTTELRDMNSVNKALANAAMERVDAVRMFLLNLQSPSTGYGPEGTLSANDITSWELEEAV